MEYFFYLFISFLLTYVVCDQILSANSGWISVYLLATNNSLWKILCAKQHSCSVHIPKICLVSQDWVMASEQARTRTHCALFILCSSAIIYVLTCVQYRSRLTCVSPVYFYLSVWRAYTSFHISTFCVTFYLEDLLCIIFLCIYW